MNTSYNTATVRKLLKAVFSDEELIIFCYDHFRPVHNKFSSGMDFPWRIQLLIDHCEKNDLFDELSTLIKEINPKQYDKFAPLIKGSSQIPTVHSYSGEKRIEITVTLERSDVSDELIFAGVRSLSAILGILSVKIIQRSESAADPSNVFMAFAELEQNKEIPTGLSNQQSALKQGDL